MINETDFNIIVNLHPTVGTHWVSVIRRGGGKVYYYDTFGVETPPIFLEEYVDRGSNEGIQEYDESFCGAYCLYMIYLIVRRYIIEGALDILVNQVKCPKMYDKGFCFSCKVKGEVEVNVNRGTRFPDDNDNQETCFADVNGNGNDNVNQGTCFADVNNNVNQGACFADGNVNAKDNSNDNGNGETWPATHSDNDVASAKPFHGWSGTHDDDKYVSTFGERHEVLGPPTKQRDKPCSLCRCCGVSSIGGKPRGKFLSPKTSGPVSPIKVEGSSTPGHQSKLLIDVNGSLQSWLDDDNKIVDAPSPESFRFVIAGPSECGETVFLKYLIMPGIQFDRVNIIGPTGDQNDD